jgi:hypothetical protein
MAPFISEGTLTNPDVVSPESGRVAAFDVPQELRGDKSIRLLHKPAEVRKRGDSVVIKACPDGRHHRTIVAKLNSAANTLKLDKAEREHLDVAKPRVLVWIETPTKRGGRRNDVKFEDVMYAVSEAYTNTIEGGGGGAASAGTVDPKTLGGQPVIACTKRCLTPHVLAKLASEDVFVLQVPETQDPFIAGLVYLTRLDPRVTPPTSIVGVHSVPYPLSSKGTRDNDTPLSFTDAKLLNATATPSTRSVADHKSTNAVLASTLTLLSTPVRWGKCRVRKLPTTDADGAGEKAAASASPEASFPVRNREALDDAYASLGLLFPTDMLLCGHTLGDSGTIDTRDVRVRAAIDIADAFVQSTGAANTLGFEQAGVGALRAACIITRVPWAFSS